MVKNILDLYTIRETSSIRNSLYKLEKNKDKCLAVINNSKKLLGTLTDGDVRRALINGVDFSQSIKKIFNKKPFYIKAEKRNKLLKNIPKRFFRDYKIIPVINRSKQLTDIISQNSLETTYKKNNRSKIFENEISVVIMAGGEGKRLLPHTAIIPKPLIPYKGKSMIDHIIERFKNCFFSKFIITLNYKSKLMKAYFSSEKFNSNIKFLKEKKPLGTAGSLKKINTKKIKQLFVVNCDSLIECDYNSIVNYHFENKYDLTIVASKKTEIFNYGSCVINKKGNLLKIHEKPQSTYLANTGFYFLNSKVLKLIKKNESVDMNDLIERLIKNKFKIGVFPIHESDWLDLGTWNRS